MLRRLLARPLTWLVLALLLEGAVVVKGQGDFIASDPLWYSVNAHELALGHDLFQPDELHPFVMRIGLIVPLAALYKVFGVSTLVSNLPALIAGLGCLLLLYLAASTSRRKALALGFGLTSIPLVHQADLLNIDLPCAVLLGFAVWFMSRRDEHRGWLVAAVTACFAGFLVKETALWCAPIWIWAVVVDVRAAGMAATMRRYLPAIVVGAILIAAYLALCAHLWGDPLARFHGIEALTDDHAWTLQGKPASAWLARMIWDVPALMWRTFFLALVPAILAFWFVRGRERIWLVAATTFLALYWFGSASLRAYTPLPISERMFISVLPPALVLATLGTDALIDRWHGRRWLVPVLAVFAIVMIVPAARIDLGLVRRATPETHAFAAFRARLDRDPQPALLVCADPRGPAIGGFYFGLVPRPGLEFIFAGDLAAHPPAPGTHVYALVNTLRGHDPIIAGRIDALHFPSIYSQRYIRLVDAGDGEILARALQR